MNKTKYSVRQNIERIADNFEKINLTLQLVQLDTDRIEQRLDELVRKETQYTEFKNGISAICKNEYASNLRMDEIIRLIKELFSADKDVC